MRGIGGYPTGYVAMAYLDWLKTQEKTPESVNAHERYTKEGGTSWLLDVPELYSRRAPGNTCLSALRLYERSGEYGTIDHRINQSKGCGGIMRVAPLALAYRIGENYHGSLGDLDKIGAELAAITHGHSLGYMPAAVLVHIINRILTAKDRMTLKEIVFEARDTVSKVFSGDPHLGELENIVNLALKLSENDADDLCHGCQMSEYSHYEDPAWVSKYMQMHRYGGKQAHVPGDEIALEAKFGDLVAESKSVDAIVNAAVTSIKDTGAGVNGAVHKAAGPELQKKCITLSGCDVGGAKITDAYNLPCKAIIHTVGPVWRGGKKHEQELLADCYRNSLRAAAKNDIRTIAFPSISTGGRRFPVELAAETAVREVTEFTEANPGKIERIIWMLSDDVTYKAYNEALLRYRAGKIVATPALDSINRILRDGIV